MNKINSKLGELKLIGLACRTNNKAEMTSDNAKIGSTIEKYFSDLFVTKIDNRKQPGITYCVYTDYESDFTGDYTFFIGEQVESFDNTPKDFGQLLIPSQNYTKFTTVPGPMPKVCIDAWQNIWAMPPNELGGERSYLADFEIYDERAKDLKNTVLDIYIGIKNQA